MTEEARVTPEAEKRAWNPVRRLYDWVLHWAETPYGGWALAAMAFAESSFFPVPPDVLLIALGISIPKKALKYAAMCTVASVLGGIFGYFIGAELYEIVGRRIIEFYGAQRQFEALRVTYGEYGFLAILTAGLTPIPYKVFTIAAGVCHESVGLGVLVLASIVGRGGRFFAVGALIGIFGARTKIFIDKYFNLLTIIFMVLLVVGFVLVKVLL